MLNPNEVNDLFMSCLLTDEEIENGAPKPGVELVLIEGVISQFGLHAGRLHAAKETIRGWVQELPVQFGSGWSFLMLCNDKYGEQWTGMHQVMEQLVVLCIGSGLMEYCAPREAWHKFPGGMPYVRVLE